MVPAHAGATGAEEFARFPALKSVVGDAGPGLGKGLSLARARRRAAWCPDRDDPRDGFHPLPAGARTRRTMGAGATRVLEHAAAAPPQGDRRERPGPSRTGYATPARRQGRRPERIGDQAAAAETAWGQVRAAFEFFPPAGLLHDRHRAEAVVAAAFPHLTGPTGAKTRRLLPRPASFTFRDQGPRRWAGRGLEPEVRSAVLDREELRRQPWRRAGTTRAAAAPRAWALARTVELAKTRLAGQEQAHRVRGVLGGVWRASSLVEWVNRVVRMQQARHR